MDCNPKTCKENLITSSSKEKETFIEKHSWYYSVSVLRNHHQDY